jgi:hypothetical protein
MIPLIFSGPMKPERERERGQRTDLRNSVSALRSPSLSCPLRPPPPTRLAQPVGPPHIPWLTPPLLRLLFLSPGPGGSRPDLAGRWIRARPATARPAAVQPNSMYQPDPPLPTWFGELGKNMWLCFVKSLSIVCSYYDRSVIVLHVASLFNAKLGRSVALFRL